MKTQGIAAIVFMLVFGLAVTAQSEPVTETETPRIGADVAQTPCEGQTPKGDQIGPRDQTRGQNPPRDGRGIGRGQGRGLRNDSGIGRGQGYGLCDGRGVGPDRGYGRADGRGPGRGQGRGGRTRQGPRDGSGPGCPAS
ncbi:MAG: hypothetical protein RBR19_17795 [Sedimentisphaerales bacterium]|jgi:hypothetical protein|nr:hypothetical protein [Sedimentisphaerales bacterium]NLT75903.1 hypothetical protein [Planctomycetota bacterium]